MLSSFCFGHRMPKNIQHYIQLCWLHQNLLTGENNHTAYKPIMITFHSSITQYTSDCDQFKEYKDDVFLQVYLLHHQCDLGER
jgi:hypothetical protein